MDFVCEKLQLTQAAMVYPLIRESVRGLTLRAWMRFAKTLAMARRSRDGGVMVIRRVARPHPCGLFLYRREQDLAHGPILVAEHVVAMDLLDPGPVMTALVEQIDLVARQMGCAAIRTVLLGSGGVLSDRLAMAGHAPDGETLWKKLPEVAGDGADPAVR